MKEKGVSFGKVLSVPGSFAVVVNERENGVVTVLGKVEDLKMMQKIICSRCRIGQPGVGQDNRGGVTKMDCIPMEGCAPMCTYHAGRSNFLRG